MKKFYLFVALAMAAIVHAQGAMPVTPGAISLFYENGEYIFRTESGLTIYTYDKDSPLKSACVDECAKNWPPLVADQDAVAVGDWKPVSRSDGTQQWTYQGKPLYTYIKDAPSTIKGDGLGGVWHQVKP